MEAQVMHMDIQMFEWILENDIEFKRILVHGLQCGLDLYLEALIKMKSNIFDYKNEGQIQNQNGLND